MSKEVFSPIELDAIGEIMNISLGSSATAVSNMLDHRVDITTPKVSVILAKDFSLGDLEPAVGVEIQYVTGLEGSNLMLLKMSDVKVIVDILMGMETPDEEFELNDLTLSAVCEVMNQMMGSAATALSDFLGRMVNISTPETFDGNNVTNMLKERLPDPGANVVVVEFSLSIEGSMESRFMNVMSVKLAKELVSGFGLGEDEVAELPEAPEPEPGKRSLSQAEIEAMMAASAPEPEPTPETSSGGKLSQEEIERLMMGAAAPAPAPVPAPQPVPQPTAAPPASMPAAGMPAAAMPAAAMPNAAMPNAAWEMQQQMQQMMMQQMQQMQQQMMQMAQMQHEAAPASRAPRSDPKVIATKGASMPRLDDGTMLSDEQEQNLDLIMGVPLEIAVEIGRTRKKVQEILCLSKGSLVVLDKLAGDQVDVFVNGKCIAHGDVVVIDDNFGIRISEILNKPGLEDLT